MNQVKRFNTGLYYTKPLFYFMNAFIEHAIEGHTGHRFWFSEKHFTPKRFLAYDVFYGMSAVNGYVENLSSVVNVDDFGEIYFEVYIKKAENVDLDYYFTRRTFIREFEELNFWHSASHNYCRSYIFGEKFNKLNFGISFDEMTKLVYRKVTKNDVEDDRFFGKPCTDPFTQQLFHHKLDEVVAYLQSKDPYRAVQSGPIISKTNRMFFEALEVLRSA